MYVVSLSHRVNSHVTCNIYVTTFMLYFSASDPCVFGKTSGIHLSHTIRHDQPGEFDQAGDRQLVVIEFVWLYPYSYVFRTRRGLS